MLMPTQRQLEYYAALHARFGRTAEFRAVADGCDFSRLNSAEAYAFIANLIDATRRWRFVRLPRYAGPPRTADERRRNLKRGIAALCLGGGNAVALAVERYE